MPKCCALHKKENANAREEGNRIKAYVQSSASIWSSIEEDEETCHHSELRCSNTP